MNADLRGFLSRHLTIYDIDPMQCLKRLFGSSSAPAAVSVRRVTVRDPLVIVSPRIGVLNLAGAAAQSILEEDKAALKPLVASWEESTGKPPLCDVLMIYAQLQGDGRIAGTSDGLRDIIRKANAPIVIVASENDGRSYVAAGKRTGYGQANLVMTVSRRGAAFPKFLAQLFRRMFEGKSMPMAWVELAPQVPGMEHKDLPGLIFAAEISHIVFKRPPL